METEQKEVGVIRAASTEDHERVVEPFRPSAVAIPPDDVQQPTVPVPVFVEESRAVVAAATELLVYLVAVGMPPERIEELAKTLEALHSANAIWQRERREGRSEVTAELLEKAEQLKADVLAAGVLALRNSSEGRRRMALIREGTGTPHLVASLSDLAVLVTDLREQFVAIHMEVDEKASELAGVRAGLSGALAADEVGKGLSGAKDMRDRIYTLCLHPLREIRAFAEFAFRHDGNDRRRSRFASAYSRERHRRSNRKKAAATEPADVPVADEKDQAA